MKLCKTCKTIKHETEFYVCGPTKSRLNRNTLSVECKECTKRRTKKNSTKEQRRFNNVKLKYNLSKDNYRLLVALHPKCPICNNEFVENEPVIDHCHQTGAIRGLLCHSCNHGLGRFKDNIEYLQSAINYLIKSLAADRPLKDIPAVNLVL